MNKTYRLNGNRKFTLEACSRGGSSVRGYETAEDARQRMLQDAKGMVLREGVTYTAEGVTAWQKRRALHGRTNQIEMTANGQVVLTTGESKLKNKLRWLKSY